MDVNTLVAAADPLCSLLSSREVATRHSDAGALMGERASGLEPDTRVGTGDHGGRSAQVREVVRRGSQGRMPGGKPVSSDDIEGEVVQNRLLGRFGILADQVDLTVRATTMVKAHDVSVRG